MLEGKTVNLRVAERDDADLVFTWFNDVDFLGEYTPIVEQISKSELLKRIDNPSEMATLIEMRTFIVQKKDGTRIGLIYHRLN